MSEKKETLHEFMFRVRCSEIKRKPKKRYYWQIIKDRINLIQSAVKAK
jgi:hypothetical protein